MERYPECISKVVNVPMSGSEGTRSSRGAAAVRAARADISKDW